MERGAAASPSLPAQLRSTSRTTRGSKHSAPDTSRVKPDRKDTPARPAKPQGTGSSAATAPAPASSPLAAAPPATGAAAAANTTTATAAPALKTTAAAPAAATAKSLPTDGAPHEVPCTSGAACGSEQERGGSGAGAAAPPVTCPGAPHKPIPVMCSPPAPEHLAAKRLRELDRRGSGGATVDGGGDDGAAKRAKGLSGERRGPAGSPDGGSDTEDQVSEPGASPEVAGGDAGAGARRPATIYGVFHPDKYLNGEDCIDYQGNFITRSKFEKLGGSLMAKWYRSIRVVATDEPLGTWLTRRGLPVLKGNPRNRKPLAATPGAAAPTTATVPTAATLATAAAAAAAADGSGAGGPGGQAAAGRIRKGSASACEAVEGSSPGARTAAHPPKGSASAAAAAAAASTEPANKPGAKAAPAAKPPAAGKSPGGASAPPRTRAGSGGGAQGGVDAGAAAATTTASESAAKRVAAPVGAKTGPAPMPRSRSTSQSSSGDDNDPKAAPPAPPPPAVGDASSPLLGSAKAAGNAPPASAAAAGGPAAAVAVQQAGKRGSDPTLNPRCSGGPCGSGFTTRATGHVPLYNSNGSSIVQRGPLTEQQRCSPSDSSQVSSAALLQTSGASYGTIPAAAAVAAAAAGAAGAVAGGAEVPAPTLARASDVDMTDVLRFDGGGNATGAAAAAAAAGGTRSGAAAAAPAVHCRPSSTCGPALPDLHMPVDDGDAAWLRFAWADYGGGGRGDEREAGAPAPGAPCAVLGGGGRQGPTGLGPSGGDSDGQAASSLQLGASLPGVHDPQLSYRTSAADRPGCLPDQATAAPRLPPQFREPAAAAAAAAAGSLPHSHHAQLQHQARHDPLPPYDQLPYVQDAAPWPQTLSSAASGQWMQSPTESYGAAASGYSWHHNQHHLHQHHQHQHNQHNHQHNHHNHQHNHHNHQHNHQHNQHNHQHNQHQHSTSVDRVSGSLVGLVAAPPPPVNRIEQIKLELLRGARGGGASQPGFSAASGPQRPPDPLQPLGGGALPPRRAVANSFEARVESLMRSGASAAAAAAAAATSVATGPPGWGLAPGGTTTSVVGIGGAGCSAAGGGGGAGGGGLGMSALSSRYGSNGGGGAMAWLHSGPDSIGVADQVYGNRVLARNACVVPRLPCGDMPGTVGLPGCGDVGAASEAMGWAGPMGHLDLF